MHWDYEGRERRRLHAAETPDKHRQRHVLLHSMLEELMTDYLWQHKDMPLNQISMLDLYLWSRDQARSPEEGKE